ncbi:hypothetical protein HYW39_02460 [Candidatus Curtissbacteria bacterium]|nr:hypothetical protein [Candidatus Curtissbacteria bacterium]MBI2594537.1 hypothetical protein [Candidatus Curtissbacteria bacterium]
MIRSADTNRNLVAAVSYLLFFITGIVILLVEKEDRFIRFHAFQSTLVFGGLFVASFILDLILAPIDLLATLVNTLIWIAIIIVWASSIVRAYQGKIFKWPIAGNLAQKQVG